jgi:FAD/FMN-containing dehydrogenase
MTWRTLRSRLGWVLLLVILATVLPPLSFLGVVAWRDRADALPPYNAGYGDASWLASAQPREVISVNAENGAAERQIAELVRRAAKEKRVVSIAGASHSMGGHTLMAGGVVLDLRAFRHMTLADDGTLTVGAGARWCDVIPFLDERGRSVAVMQSNNDFSVGGSLSVNCDGRRGAMQPDGEAGVVFARAGRVRAFRRDPGGGVDDGAERVLSRGVAARPTGRV